MESIRLTVDLDRADPVYKQLKQNVKRLIKRGQCSPGRRLPTVRQIALDLELNANTVKRICADLEQDGILMWREGAGVYSKQFCRTAGAVDLTSSHAQDARDVLCDHRVQVKRLFVYLRWHRGSLS